MCVCVCVCVCIIGYGGQNDKVLLKIFKLFRIIQKKKFINFFQKFGGAKAPFSSCDGSPLLTERRKINLIRFSVYQLSTIQINH